MKLLRDNNSGIIGISLIIWIVLLVIAISLISFFFELLMIIIIAVIILSLVLVVIKFMPMPYKLYASVILLIGFAVLGVSYYLGYLSFMIMEAV